MTRRSLALHLTAGFASAVTLGFGTAWAQPAVPQIAFDSVVDPIELPKDMSLGEASGVAVNSKGHVFVELVGDPDSEKSQRAMTAMLQLKKIDLAALKKAYEGQACGRRPAPTPVTRLHPRRRSDRGPTVPRPP